MSSKKIKTKSSEIQSVDIIGAHQKKVGEIKL
jgi:hypothetical protein